MALSTKNRMLYIDALRGVTMFLVVYHHVLDKCFKHAPFIDSVIQSFRMPIFFFVSGLVAYKSLEFWTGKNTRDRLVKKVRSQVIPTLIFFSIYFYFMRGCRPLLLLYQYGWRQYWFTIVLFEYFVVYYTVNYLTRKSAKLNSVSLVVVVITSIIVYHSTKFAGKFVVVTEAFKFIQYFPFFIAGTFARKHYDKLVKILDNWWLILLVLVLFVVQIPVLKNDYHLSEQLNNFVTIWFIRVTGMVLVFSLFVKMRDKFTATSRVTRCLTFVGRRTLDIYLMHFFFIAHLPKFHYIVCKGVPAVVDQLFAIAFAVFVTCICLLVSAIIRKNKFLGNLLFAAK